MTAVYTVSHFACYLWDVLCFIANLGIFYENLGCWDSVEGTQPSSSLQRASELVSQGVASASS